MKRLGNQAEFFAQLHGLRPAFCPQLIENPAGVSLDRVFADEQLLGNLPVAHSHGDQSQDLNFARRDPQVRSFILVRNKTAMSQDRHFFEDDLLFGPGQLQAKPDAEDSKDSSRQAAINFDGMLDHQKSVFSPLEQSDKYPAQQTIDKDVALHRSMASYWSFFPVSFKTARGFPGIPQPSILKAKL